MPQVRTLLTTVADASIKTEAQARAAFWDRMEAANGGREGDPRDYISIIEPVVRDARGFVFRYEVPAEVLEQRAVSVIRDEPENNYQDVVQEDSVLQLTKGLVSKVDAEDLGWLSEWKWTASDVKGDGSKYYAVRTVIPIPGKKEHLLLHRAIWQKHHGSIPEGLQIDHLNGDCLDNRLSNLRLCNQSQNNGNQKKTRGTSRFKGVSWNSSCSKWAAQIQCEYKHERLGLFESEEDAAKAYDKRARELFGEYARINFPSSEDEMDDGTSEIETSKIIISGWNPRKAFDPQALQALAEDIRQNELINAITVRPRGKSKYELVAGERRLRAFRLLGRATIPAKVRELTDEQVLDIMLAENLQRVDLNPIEEAHHLKRVLEVCKLTQTDLGKRIGKSQEWVSQRLRLAEAPGVLQDMIISRQINTSSAIEVLQWRNTEHYDTIMHEIGAWTVEGEELPRARVREIIKEITEPVAKRLPREATPDISVAPPLNGEIAEPTDPPFVNPEDCKDCDIYDRENDECPEGCTCAEECEMCFSERPEDEGEKQDLPDEPEPAAEAEKESDVPEENVPSEPTMLDGHRKLLAAAKEGADGVNQWKCNICGHGFTVKPERADNVARMLEHLCNRLMFDSPGQATGEHKDALRRVSRAIAEGRDTWGLLQKLFHQAGPEGN